MTRDPRAVFLDRDGTVVQHVPHLADPADVRLLRGAGDGIRRLNAAGWQVVLVTNQSVVARGLASAERVAAVHARLAGLLAAEGAYLDAVYVCPHHPDFGPPGQHACACRKPQPGLLLRAAQERGLDLARCVLVGDACSDVLAGQRAGCYATLQVGAAQPDCQPTAVVPDLEHAAAWVLARGAGGGRRRRRGLSGKD